MLRSWTVLLLLAIPVGGETVLEYTRPQLDDGTPLDRGTISLQAEGHPVEFRKVELLRLDTEREATP